MMTLSEVQNFASKLGNYTVNRADRKGFYNLTYESHIYVVFSLSAVLNAILNNNAKEFWQYLDLHLTNLEIDSLSTWYADRSEYAHFPPLSSYKQHRSSQL